MLSAALFAAGGGYPFLGTLFVLYVAVGGGVPGEVYGPEIYWMGIFRVAGDRYLYIYRLFGEQNVGDFSAAFLDHNHFFGPNRAGNIYNNLIGNGFRFMGLSGAGGLPAGAQ